MDNQRPRLLQPVSVFSASDVPIPPLWARRFDFPRTSRRKHIWLHANATGTIPDSQETSYKK
jgi:hypothetical protein